MLAVAGAAASGIVNVHSRRRRPRPLEPRMILVLRSRERACTAVPSI